MQALQVAQRRAEALYTGSNTCADDVPMKTNKLRSAWIIDDIHTKFIIIYIIAFIVYGA